MNHPHDDDAPVEHDPTGVRALLAGLPDPGPMPDDLVARITAALAAEAGASRPRAVPAPVAGAGAGAGDAREEDEVDHPFRVASTPASVHRPARRRPLARHLAVAAAVVGAVGVGGLALQVSQGGLLASFDASSAGSGDSGAASSVEEKDMSGGAAPQAVPEAGSAVVVVVTSGQGYSSAGLAQEAGALTSQPGSRLRELAAEAPSLGPIATPIGARSCATALGISPTAGVLVDLADVDGRPAAVLVATDDTGRTAWAVERSCTTGTTGLISGPVAVG